jgi:hypothetical protein
MFIRVIYELRAAHNEWNKTLTSLAAEYATPEYTYLSTINVMPLLIRAFIVGLKTEFLNY